MNYINGDIRYKCKVNMYVPKKPAYRMQMRPGKRVKQNRNLVVCILVHMYMTFTSPLITLFGPRVFTFYFF